ncbi:hypothetical protein F7725_001154 [Dissostichus mawsoni]|uniref:Uncharacterized protein n=1 Tax=Dissostichus mawsoni TaxID=36200 RepID=A0A7J5ZIW8_DISMA|nr:hypothetical protein F7725_001154 [Dissostichus mawsoni]
MRRLVAERSEGGGGRGAVTGGFQLWLQEVTGTVSHHAKLKDRFNITGHAKRNDRTTSGCVALTHT